MTRDGRFAPSPTGTLHLGNLRTALLAWLFARSAGARFLVRMEDLDSGRVKPGVAEEQLADLAAIGLDWDGEVVYQSPRLDVYADAIAQLRAAGRVYECFCTRAEIRAAASAPHGPLPEGAYPGTCLRLTEAERRRSARAAGRRRCACAPSGAHVTFTDRLLGPQEGVVDDFVIQRNDGAPAYNLAVVVDDAVAGDRRGGARRRPGRLHAAPAATWPACSDCRADMRTCRWCSAPTARGSTVQSTRTGSASPAGASIARLSAGASSSTISASITGWCRWCWSVIRTTAAASIQPP